MHILQTAIGSDEIIPIQYVRRCVSKVAYIWDEAINSRRGCRYLRNQSRPRSHQQKCCEVHSVWKYGLQETFSPCPRILAIVVWRHCDCCCHVLDFVDVTSSDLVSAPGLFKDSNAIATSFRVVKSWRKLGRWSKMQDRREDAHE